MQQAGRSGAGELLLVEDEPNDLALILRALREEGVSQGVVVAKDGVQALGLLLGEPSTPQTAIRPRLILLDLKLPKVSGLDVLRRLRSSVRTRLLPVVLFTSSDGPEDRAAAYQAGCNGFVRKPTDLPSLRETLRAVARYWLDLNRGPPAEERRP